MTKVMVVEDDNSLREIYSDSLQAEGFEVITAADGEEALATAVKERPDVIVLDVMMPKISGFDVLDILRSTPETKNAHIMMMTALSQQSDRERGERLGADRYLVKSQVTVPDIIDNVKQLLTEPVPSKDSSEPTSHTPKPINVPGLPVADVEDEQSSQADQNASPATEPDTSPASPSPAPTPAAANPTPAATDTAAPTTDDSATAQFSPPQPTTAPAPAPTIAPATQPPTTADDDNATDDQQPAVSPSPAAPTATDSPDAQSARDAISKLAESQDQEAEVVDKQVADFAANPEPSPSQPAPSPAPQPSTPQPPTTAEPAASPSGDDVENQLHAEIDAISDELDNSDATPAPAEIEPKRHGLPSLGPNRKAKNTKLSPQPATEQPNHVEPNQTTATPSTVSRRSSVNLTPNQSDPATDQTTASPPPSPEPTTQPVAQPQPVTQNTPTTDATSTASQPGDTFMPQTATGNQPAQETNPLIKPDSTNPDDIAL